MSLVNVTSMAHSLEVRVPMLDHRIVEFAAALPEEMKQKGFGKDRTKKIIRHYLKRRFPDSFINRPKKGFGMPLAGAVRANVEERVRQKVSGTHCALPACLLGGATETLLDSPGLSPNGLWVLYALCGWNGGLSR